MSFWWHERCMKIYHLTSFALERRTRFGGRIYYNWDTRRNQRVWTMEECQHTSHYHVDLDRTTNSHGVVPNLWHGSQHQGKCSPNFQAHNVRSTMTSHTTLMWQECLASLAFDSFHVSIEYCARKKEKKNLLMTIANLCHWSVANGGCFIVGISHPSHSFKEPYLTVYKIAWKAK